MKTLDDLLERLWKDYASANVQAHQIHVALEALGETVVNDHIALRTFNLPAVNVDVVARSFVQLGYEEKEHYAFEAKQLDAKHYEHPDSKYPRIFVSELRVEAFSESLQRLVQRLVSAVSKALTEHIDFPARKVPWPMISYVEYEALREESEYAAWLAAFGFCANHFTVNVNALKRFESLHDFNTFIRQAGYTLNESGGDIKGSPEVFLEQSSTLASKVEVPFSDGVREIPGCYYEFAKRYPLPDGRLFSGFVAKSADKIFESTDKR